MEFSARDQSISEYNRTVLDSIFDLYGGSNDTKTAERIARLPCFEKLGSSLERRVTVLLNVRMGILCGGTYDPHFHVISADDFREDMTLADFIPLFSVRRPFVPPS